jgi:hypothetical protein
VYILYCMVSLRHFLRPLMHYQQGTSIYAGRMGLITA